MDLTTEEDFFPSYISDSRHHTTTKENPKTAAACHHAELSNDHAHFPSRLSAPEDKHAEVIVNYYKTSKQTSRQLSNQISSLKSNQNSREKTRQSTNKH